MAALARLVSMPASLSAILSTVARYSIPFGVVRYCLRERERDSMSKQPALYQLRNVFPSLTVRKVSVKHYVSDARIARELRSMSRMIDFVFLKNVKGRQLLL